jgi:hypothetical protein
MIAVIGTIYKLGYFQDTITNTLFEIIETKNYQLASILIVHGEINNEELKLKYSIFALDKNIPRTERFCIRDTLDIMYGKKLSESDIEKLIEGKELSLKNPVSIKVMDESTYIQSIQKVEIEDSLKIYKSTGDIYVMDSDGNKINVEFKGESYIVK